MSVAGPCEWCGGPQVWTIIRNEMYVSCDGGCAPLPGLGLEPPPMTASVDRREPEVEPLERGGVRPLEGGATKVSVEGDPELPF